MPPSKRLFVQMLELTYQGNNIYIFTCFNHWIYWPLNTNFFLLETVMRRLENSNLPAPADTPSSNIASVSHWMFLSIKLFSASSQLIVHSSKVRTPQRHNSESVLYMNDEGKTNGTNSTEDLSSEQFQHRSSRSDNRLFPINTYTEPISLSASTTSLDSK